MTPNRVNLVTVFLDFHATAVPRKRHPAWFSGSLHIGL
jgi:hypothetical protein